MRATAQIVSTLRRGAPALARRFGTASQGVAAVEFAMVLPFMIILYLGMVEVTNAVSTDHRVTLLARTLADLTGQQTKVTSASSSTSGETLMDSVFGAAFAVMAPYKAESISMTVTSVAVKPTSTTAGSPVQGKVCWSDARVVTSGALSKTGATPLAAGTVAPVPAGFDTPTSSFIRADVVLNYNPMFGSSILKYITGNSVSAITFTENMPWPVRNTSEVKMSGVQPSPTNCLS